MLRKAIGIAFAADTVSIATMEVIDNAFIVAVPGALDAQLTDALFWWSLVISLIVAFVVTVPVNRTLIARGKGHAVVHAHHTDRPHRGRPAPSLRHEAQSWELARSEVVSTKEEAGLTSGFA